MRIMKHRLLAWILAVVVAFTTVGGDVTAQAASPESNQEEYAGYLFAYFTASSMAIHFAVSADGYHYTALNGNKPVVTQTVGRKAARDPYIIKGQDGDYYMLATDLKGGDKNQELTNKGEHLWGANTSIVTWHSADLVHWDNETLITIRGEYESTRGENQNFVWAPEAIWDKDKGEYMIFWSMQGGTEHGDNLMIWYAYTKDFKTLTSEPAVLYNPGVTGLNLAPVGNNGSDCIDANIVEHGGKYYMYYKWSGGSGAGIQVAVSDSLTGDYLPVGYDTVVGSSEQQSPGELCGSAYVEGGDVYKLNGQEKWILVADHNWSKFYGMAESTDLIHWTDVDDEDCTINFTEGDGNPKHGAVIPITAEQYAALWEEWGVSEADGTAAPSEENGGLLQKASIQGAHVIKEEIDEIDHVVTQYVSVNNSKVKNWKNAAIDFTVLSGFKISGLKATYNLLDGAKVTITSKTDPSDREEWTVRVIPCNNPAISGLYADPDIDIFDGKYYIYPTTDGFTGWNTQKFHVFSSEDMVSWKDEGVILDLSAGDVAWADTKNCYAWAPAIEQKNGKYYFYFCGRDKSTNQQAIGVAVADSPTGPFTAKAEPLMTKQACQDAGGQLTQVIDPAIYTDEESGDSYMLFGNGRNGYNIVKLNDDMVSWDADTMYHYPNELFVGYRESIHVFKKDGKYHFTWSCNDTGEDTYSINYAVADTLYPEKNEDGTWGTFTAKNRGTILYKVPENDILGTGHHCFVKLPNREEYYIAYARFRTPLSEYPGDKDVKGCHREICLEPVTFDENGYIEPITPTLEGIQEPVYVNPPKEPEPEPEHKHEYKEGVTPATTKADGKIVSQCACGDIKSTVVIPRIKDVKLSAETFVYNKKVKTPGVTVYDRNSGKVSSANYSVVQSSGRKKVGTYKVTVKFKGNYSGTVTKNFKIVPAGVKLTKVSAAKKGFIVKWKKGSDITGYELQYSTSSKFSKAKTKKAAKAKTSSKKVTGLKAKKKYYVRIRTYKMVGKVKYVSGWSKAKNIKTK